MRREAFGTRSEQTMIDWARTQTTITLWACRAEAVREGDRDQVRAIDAELRRRAAA